MNELIENDDVIIENMIYKIRGKEVMIASDLAKLYNVETKRINEAVKRNPLKFPLEFCFQVSKDEYYKILRSQNATLELKQGKYSKYLPYVFTEQGVAMLATVLKSKTAIVISIRIMKAFVKMRHIITNKSLELFNMQNMLIKHDNDLKKLQEMFKEFKLNKNEIYYEGQIYDAYSKIVDIFKEANKELIIIDGYADKVF